MVLGVGEDNSNPAPLAALRLMHGQPGYEVRMSQALHESHEALVSRG